MKLSSQAVFERVGQLAVSVRKTQANIINDLTKNMDDTSKRALQSCYGYLLQRLSLNSPKRALAQLLIDITDESVVHQQRVNKVAALYARDPHPSIAKLLQAMRRHAGPEIYIPPAGQKNIQNAQLPMTVSSKLCSGDLSLLVPVYAKIFAGLQSKNEIAVAKIMAELYPLVISSGMVPLPIEEHTYKVLRSYDGNQPLFTIVLAKYFRYWPAIDTVFTMKNLLEPLVKTIDPAPLFKELFWLGPVAKDLMDSLVEKVQSWTPELYVPVLLFYKSTGSTPPSSFIRHLVINMPGCLFICRAWARAIPTISKILQGEMPLNSTVHDLSDRYDLANNPWLGTFPSKTFEQMTDYPCPLHITEEVFQKHNLSFTDFCNTLLDNIKEAGLSIDEYIF